MIIWYLHSFYTRWFESGAVFGVWLPQKFIDKWLWRIFIGCAVTTLVSRCLCCCPGSLHLDTALLVKWDTYSGPHGLTHLSDSLPPCAYQQFSDFCAWQLYKSSCQHFYFCYLFFPSTFTCVATSWSALTCLSILFTVCFHSFDGQSIISKRFRHKTIV